MLKSKYSNFYMTLLLITVLLLFSIVLVNQVGVLGDAKRVINKGITTEPDPIQEIKVEEKPIIKDPITIDSDREYILDNLLIREHNSTDLPKSEENKLIITISDFDVLPEYIAKNKFLVFTDLDQEKSDDYREFCFIDKVDLYDLVEGGTSGSPIDYYYRFNQLLPNNKTIDTIDIYYSDPVTLFSDCEMAPAYSLLSSSGLYLKEEYDNYSKKYKLFSNNKTSNQFGFNVLSYELRPIKYDHNKRSATIYKSVTVVINLRDVRSNPFRYSKSQFDMMLNSLYYSEDEYSLNESQSLEQIIDTYPKYSQQENRSGEYADTVIIVSDTPTDSATDMINAASSYFDGAKFTKMNDILNHSWGIADKIPNFNTMDAKEKDQAVCKFFYKNIDSSMNNLKDITFDPAAQFRNNLKINIGYNGDYSSDDFSAILSNGYLMPYNEQMNDNYPDNTIVHIYYAYENKQLDDGGEVYHPGQCFGSLGGVNGWEPPIIPGGYVPEYPEDSEYYDPSDPNSPYVGPWDDLVNSGAVPVRQLGSTLSCLAGFPHVSMVTPYAVEILNKDTGKFFTYFGQNNSDRFINFHLINSNSFSEHATDDELNYCLSTHMSFGPFNLAQILEATYHIKLYQAYESIQGESGLPTDVSALISQFVDMYAEYNPTIFDFNDPDLSHYYFVKDNFFTCIGAMIPNSGASFSAGNDDGSFYCSQPYFSESPAVKLRNYIKYESYVGFSGLANGFATKYNSFILLGDADQEYLFNTSSQQNNFYAVPFKNLNPDISNISYAISEAINNVNNFNNQLSGSTTPNSFVLPLTEIKSKDLAADYTSMAFIEKKPGANDPTDYFARVSSVYCDPFQTGNEFKDLNYSQLDVSSYDLYYGYGAPSLYNPGAGYINTPAKYSLKPVPSDYYYRSLINTNYNINYCERKLTQKRLNEEDSENVYNAYYMVYSSFMPLIDPESADPRVTITCEMCVLKTHVDSRIANQNNFNGSILFKLDNIFGIYETRDVKNKPTLENVQAPSVYISRIPASSVADFKNWENNVNLFKKKINIENPLTKPAFYSQNKKVGWDEIVIAFGDISGYFRSKSLTANYNMDKYNSPYFYNMTGFVSSSDNSAFNNPPFLDVLLLNQKYGLSNITVLSKHGLKWELAGTSLDTPDVANQKYKDTYPNFYVQFFCNNGDYTVPKYGSLNNSNFQSNSIAGFDGFQAVREHCKNVSDCSAVETGLFKTGLMSGMVAATEETIHWKYGSMGPNNNIANIGESQIARYIPALFLNTQQTAIANFNSFLQREIFDNKIYKTPGMRNFLNNLYAYNYYGDPNLKLNISTERTKRDFEITLVNQSTTSGSNPQNEYVLNIKRNNLDNLYAVNLYLCANQNQLDNFDYSNFGCGQYNDLKNNLPDLSPNPQISKCYALDSIDLGFWTKTISNQIRDADKLLLLSSDPNTYPQFISDYSEYNMVANSTTDFVLDHFSSNVSETKGCFDPRILNNTKIKLHRLDTYSVIFYNEKLTKNSNVSLKLNISQADLISIIDIAKNKFRTNNIPFREINLVAAVQPLGSSTNQVRGTNYGNNFENLRKFQSNPGYHNCDYFEEKCATQQNCGVVSNCNDNVLVIGDLLPLSPN